MIKIYTKFEEYVTNFVNTRDYVTTHTRYVTFIELITTFSENIDVEIYYEGSL